MLPGCWRYGGDTGELKTGCTGCGTWSLARSKARCGQVRTEPAPQLPAALRHYGWKPWETLTLIGLSNHN